MTKAYKLFSTIFFSTIIILVLLNIAVLPFVDETAKQEEEYNKIVSDSLLIKNIYTQEGFDTDYINGVMNDFANHSFHSPGGEYSYYPRIEYVEALFSSPNLSINADKNDINNRTSSTDPQKNERRYHIYCFGGSTTFGSFVADKETWPAYLEKVLGDDFCIKNYGVSGYTATQETDLFISLLKLGHRPSLVIFMDGVNTGPAYDGSDISHDISSRFDQQEASFSFRKMLGQLPLVRFLQSQSFQSPLGDADLGPMELPGGKYNDIMTSRFVENSRIRKSVSESYGIDIIQVMQPNVFVKYDFKHLNDFHRRHISKETIQNYQNMYQGVLHSDTSFVDFSRLFDEYGKPALVDGMHYSPGFNKFIAVRLTTLINLKQIQPYHFMENNATGEPFK